MLLLVLMAPAFQSQNPISNSSSDFASILTFETQHTGAMPFGWGGGPPETSSSMETPFTSDDGSGFWGLKLQKLKSKSYTNLSKPTVVYD